MKTELYIKDTLVELDESVSFAITKGFNDLTNPTTIINEWTKEVNIPFTNNNHKLFGHLYNPNKEITDIQFQFIGNNFNPNLRFDFKLVHNSSVIMTGYMKMNSITREGGKGSYNITLNGMLGEIFNKIKGIGFKNSEYPIDDSKYIDTSITKDLVYNTFVTQPSNTELVEDAILSGTKKEGYYWAYQNGAFKELRSLDMAYTKISLIAGATYLIKDIQPSATYPPLFYAIILLKNDTPVKAIYPVQDGNPLKEMEFDNKGNALSSYTGMIINYYRYVDPVIIRKSNPAYTIGFTPTNSGYYKDFDSKSFTSVGIFNNSFKTMQVVDVLNNTTDFTKTNYSAESVVGDGLLPRQVGEFRSYYQQPYIYFNKLFQIFTKKAEEITGYKFDLDKNWFNENNPYWSKLCMLLNNLDISENKVATNSYYIMDYSEEASNNYWSYDKCKEIKKYQVYAHDSNEEASIYKSSTKSWSLNKNEIVKIVSNNINTTVRVEAIPTADMKLSNYSLCLFRLIFTNSTNQVVKTKKFAFMSDEGVVVKEDGSFEIDLETKRTRYERVRDMGYEVLLVSSLGEQIGDYKTWTAQIPLNEVFHYKEYGEAFKMFIEAEWTEDFAVMENGNYTTKPILWNIGYNNWTMELISNKRSFSYFTLSDLWNKEYSLYDVIVNYTKIFGLLWESDNINKKIHIVRRVDYFKDYTIEDWSDKVDFNNQFIISPIITEKRYLKFNYADLETNINKAYKEEFDVNYGELKLDTGYKFNNETSDVFENTLNPSITSTDSMIPFHGMYNGKLLIYNNTEIYPDLNNDNEKAEGFGSYFFRNENQPLNENLGRIVITDDTESMQTTNTYNYLYEYPLTEVKYPDTLPYLSIKNTTFEGYRKDNLCVFNTPQTTYSSEKYGHKSIYYNFWQNYLNERYSNKSKKVTCWVYLTPMDYYNFRFNKFVVIDNQLYFVNKLINYDIERKVATQVELLTVNDLKNYYSDNYKELILEMNTSRIIMSKEGIKANLLINVNKDFSSNNIKSDLPYSMILANRTVDYDTYKLTFTTPSKNGIYKVIATVDGVSVECQIIVNLVNKYFEFTPTSLEFPADGEEHFTYVTINTNVSYTYRTSSNKIAVLETPTENRLKVICESTIPTTEAITFTANGTKYPLTVTFTGSEFYVVPEVLNMEVYTGTTETATFKVVSSYDWEIIGDIPNTVSFISTGNGTKTIQVTSTCDYATTIDMTIREMQTSKEIPFTIVIGTPDYLEINNNEFNFPADGLVYNGFVTVDTNVDYYATIDMNEDGTEIIMTKTDDGIALQCSSNHATTKHLCITSVLGEKYVTINFI